MDSFRVRALYEYQPEAEDDLPLEAGRIVTVTEQLDSEWYQGWFIDATGSEVSGIFPINYVERISDEARNMKVEKSSVSFEPGVVPNQSIPTKTTEDDDWSSSDDNDEEKHITLAAPVSKASSLYPSKDLDAKTISTGKVVPDHHSQQATPRDDAESAVHAAEALLLPAELRTQSGHNRTSEPLDKPKVASLEVPTGLRNEASADPRRGRLAPQDLEDMDSESENGPLNAVTEKMNREHSNSRSRSRSTLGRERPLAVSVDTEDGQTPPIADFKTRMAMFNRPVGEEKPLVAQQSRQSGSRSGGVARRATFEAAEAAAEESPRQRITDSEKPKPSMSLKEKIAMLQRQTAAGSDSGHASKSSSAPKSESDSVPVLAAGSDATPTAKSALSTSDTAVSNPGHFESSGHHELTDAEFDLGPTGTTSTQPEEKQSNSSASHGTVTTISGVMSESISPRTSIVAPPPIPSAAGGLVDGDDNAQIGPSSATSTETAHKNSPHQRAQSGFDSQADPAAPSVIEQTGVNEGVKANDVDEGEIRGESEEEEARKIALRERMARLANAQGGGVGMGFGGMMGGLPHVAKSSEARHRDYSAMSQWEREREAAREQTESYAPVSMMGMPGSIDPEILRRLRPAAEGSESEESKSVPKMADFSESAEDSRRSEAGGEAETVGEPYVNAISESVSAPEDSRPDVSRTPDVSTVQPSDLTRDDDTSGDEENNDSSVATAQMAPYPSSPKFAPSVSAAPATPAVPKGPEAPSAQSPAVDSRPPQIMAADGNRGSEISEGNRQSLGTDTGYDLEFDTDRAETSATSPVTWGSTASPLVSTNTATAHPSQTPTSPLASAPPVPTATAVRSAPAPPVPGITARSPPASTTETKNAAPFARAPPVPPSGHAAAHVTHAPALPPAPPSGLAPASSGQENEGVPAIPGAAPKLSHHPPPTSPPGPSPQLPRRLPTFESAPTPLPAAPPVPHVLSSPPAPSAPPVPPTQTSPPPRPSGSTRPPPPPPPFHPQTAAPVPPIPPRIPPTQTAPVAVSPRGPPPPQPGARPAVPPAVPSHTYRPPPVPASPPPPPQPAHVPYSPPPPPPPNPHASTPTHAPPALPPKKAPPVLAENQGPSAPSGVSTSQTTEDVPSWLLQPRGVPPGIISKGDSYSVTEGRGERVITVVHADLSTTQIRAHLNGGRLDRTDRGARKPAQDSLKAASERVSALVLPTVYELAKQHAAPVTKDAALAALEHIEGVVAQMGVPIYENFGNASTTQVDEIRPGDLVVCEDARFQGSKGPLSKYQRDEKHSVYFVDHWAKERPAENGYTRDKVRVVQLVLHADLWEVNFWSFHLKDDEGASGERKLYTL